MAQNGRVVPIGKLTTTTPQDSAILGRVIRIWPVGRALYEGKMQTAQIFILKEKKDQIKVHLYGPAAAAAATIFHGQDNPVVRLHNFTVLKNTAGGGGAFRIFSNWSSKPLRTQIFEIRDPAVMNEVLFMRFNPISEMTNYNKDSHTDVLAILSAVGDETERTFGNSTRPQKFRDVVLYDSSCVKVNVTLWGEKASDFEGSVGCVLAIRNAKVGIRFGKVRLNVGSNSTVQIHPATPAADALRAWDLVNPTADGFPNISENAAAPAELQTIKDVFCTEAKERFANMIVRVMYVTGDPDNFERHFYRACERTNCSTKVAETETGQFLCRTCNKSSPRFTYAMRLCVQMADPTGGFLTTLFQKQLEAVFPISTNSLYFMSQTDRGLYKSILDQFLLDKDFQITIRAFRKHDGLNGNEWHVQKLEKVPASSGEGAAPILPQDDADAEDMGLSAHLGRIEEVDGVPVEWRENRNQSIN